MEELGFPGARAAAPLPGECSGGRAGGHTLPRAPAPRVSRAQLCECGDPSGACSACPRTPPFVPRPAPRGSSHSLGSLHSLQTPPLPRAGSGAGAAAAAAAAAG